MSSAAVQPQSSPTAQQYAQSVAARERFPAAAAAAAAAATSSPTPPSSSRRVPVSRISTDNAAHPNTPQQHQYSPRGQPSPSAAMNPATYGQQYSSPVPTSTMPSASLPIRTSNQASTPQSTATASYDGRAYASRAAQSQGESDRDRASRSARSPREEQPGSARSQRSRNTPTTSRSANAIGQPPMGSDLPRENSAVINRIVVDDPQADIAREEMRIAEARPHVAGVPISAPDTTVSAPRSRQEHLRQPTSNRKEVKFGDYILGQTLGEGEFGKVKMGWKKDSTVQVAIKLIRKESLAGNATRLPKIYREISILRELQHPNIVRLHEFVETERHMGIILEYASGGELFDYILNHRYLKDPQARRLFAQLVSGVGYLHKKGIVHRDLKLENLLLDRNKHIIITDFGFANTFDPEDELGEHVEARITDKEFIKREGLDKIVHRPGAREGGYRRGDLMQTSCGSPCYAAPELVVSDGLYTGRKVDVWSCGVILYAMLAGYLPFDDDPANPEGDNINLLYKYIVSTPLTFPEYVTPHARDLLRRILVPDPRRRADLFEVARHSWLSEYTHVVGFIGSRVKSEQDIVNTAMQTEEEPQLGRSASVREPSSRSPPVPGPPVGAPRHGPSASVGGDHSLTAQEREQRDAKRRTVQVEYVAPNVAHVRGDPGRGVAAPAPNVPTAAAPVAGRTRARPDTGPVEVHVAQQGARKPDTSMAPPTRPGRDQRTTSDSGAAFGTSAGTTGSRPATSGTLGGASRLPSRGNSYSQPVAPTPTNTTAQGSFSQPKSGSGYFMPSAGPIDTGVDAAHRPVSQQQSMTPRQPIPGSKPSGHHKRSTTLGSFADRVLSRSNSKRQSQTEAVASPTTEKKDRRYPPVSIKNVLPGGGEDRPRMSSESRRTSFGFSRKASRERRASRERDSSVQGRRTSRRFSFLPSGFNINNFTGKKDQGDETDTEDGRARTGRPESKGMAFGRGASPSPDTTTDSTIPLYYERQREAASRGQQRSAGSAQAPSRFDKALPPSPLDKRPVTGQQRPLHASNIPGPQRQQYRDDGYGSNQGQDSEPVEHFYTPDQGASRPAAQEEYPSGAEAQFNQSDPNDPQQNLRPQQRRFGDAYDHGHSGSSSATRRVMDFFRRRGKDRVET